jgi:hypothetical protein
LSAHAAVRGRALFVIQTFYNRKRFEELERRDLWQEILLCAAGRKSAACECIWSIAYRCRTDRRGRRSQHFAQAANPVSPLRTKQKLPPERRSPGPWIAVSYGGNRGILRWQHLCERTPDARGQSTFPRFIPAPRDPSLCQKTHGPENARGMGAPLLRQRSRRHTKMAS